MATEDSRFLMLLLSEGIEVENILTEFINKARVEELRKSVELNFAAEKAVLCALKSGNREALELFLQQGCPVQAESLIFAVNMDQGEFLKLFLDAGVILPETLFVPDLLSDKPNTLSLLLQRGDALDKKMILEKAIAKGNFPVVQLIVESGDENMRLWISNGIQQAARCNQKEIYRYLLEKARL